MSRQPVKDALENLLIAIGMGWNLDGVIKEGQEAITLSDEGEPETIVAAAVHSGLIYSLPRPARHHTVLRAMHFASFTQDKVAGATQGFTTSTGRFVGREEAMDIAWRAKQITGKTTHDAQLFSEDLW